MTEIVCYPNHSLIKMYVLRLERKHAIGYFCQWIFPPLLPVYRKPYLKFLSQWSHFHKTLNPSVFKKLLWEPLGREILLFTRKSTSKG